MAADNVPDAIEQNALGPKRVQVGNQSVEQQSLADQIAAAEFLQNQQARSGTAVPIRFAKIRPGGAV